ncbi:MAG: ABC transporter permease [Lachnospiraceae bacterium]|nr:ABC transporter permease [Lachnospiraceae bacterium]
MGRYILKRLLWMIPIVVGIVVLIFTILHVVPGDPAKMILGITATTEQLEALRHQLGLDQPFLVQLANYMSDLFFHLDLGESYVSGLSITQDILTRLPRTFLLGMVSMVISFVLGVLLGILAGTHQNKWQDRLCMFIALAGVSMPAFWLALMLVLLFSVQLGWLPASGMGGIRYYILPAVALSFGGIAGIARQTRSSVLEVIRSDYVTTARSKGLKENEVVMKHILPNALIPIITVAGSAFASVFGGSVVIETVFSIDGIGLYMMTGITSRDYPVVQGCVVMLGIIFSLCMLLVDIAYAFVDPRIKSQYEGEAKKKRKAVAKA